MCRSRDFILRNALGALAIAACSDQSVAPKSVLRPALSAEATKFWEASATLRWNEIARVQTLTHTVSQQFGNRSFAYLSLAQYNAAVAAEAAKRRGDHASVAAAIAAASATVLGSLYPDQAATFDAEAAGQGSDGEWPGEDHTDFAAGADVGRAVGANVVASAATDGFTNSVAGVTIPVCAGCWVSAPGKLPVFPRLAEMRTFFLLSSSQFRPGAPPAFGSPEFETALAEVRYYSDNRTHVEDSLAKFWASPNGFTNSAQSYTNQVAVEEITKFHLDEIRAAHVLAIMNMVAMDAFIASHDAKYTYWMIRPPQADPDIVLAIPLPNHPSYTSNHAAVTGSSMAVLAALFPSDASYLNGLADQAALSRIYGGIHYRFDMDAGLALGRTVASYALAHDVVGHEAYGLR
jgi:hypothetical protein